MDTRTRHDMLVSESVTLRDSLSEVNRNIYALRKDLAFQIHGVKQGVIVIDRTGKKHRIESVRIRNDVDSKPWTVGNPERKDGSFGTAQRNLYNDWELVK